ncbi:Rrf2 family transcriptional regulator [Marinobacter sp.]|jgi:Rrf2 family transcriptional regulator, nitric oxide-sensitive transcriptional repressor|uniref:RrF2 family transcriptional regulator n=1 Tax=Marinobacter sp. TaxID=50741 RepID=UPI000C0CC52B|nr:Rrf2 family transcriptional regulator [Marinobacter sp.]MBE93776.1 Rrf2 family transcriptional regulator [Marinobacter sp.]PHQ74829.1 MAG: Rrf2 family transcriptional regulator [Marinobacter sp.]|tara:strand:+ start:1449 stop:1886 length:438 start_codon:yes stop_codon:yes gene_type:complete
MHITRYTDYSLRVLVYLAVQGDELVTIQQIADSYEISRNHLMKVVHQLNKKGYIETVRGKKGGMRLQMAPGDINVGTLVRETEQDLSVVECFASGDACRITPVCGLKSMFGEALAAFLEVLDRYTLADIIHDQHRPQLLRLLQIA